MSRTIKCNDKYQEREERLRDRRARRRISVRAVRRQDPDLRRMGRALVEFALAEAEAEAAAREPGANSANDSDSIGGPAKEQRRA